jgi:hypothetical protein
LSAPNAAWSRLAAAAAAADTIAAGNLASLAGREGVDDSAEAELVWRGPGRTENVLVINSLKSP